MPLSLDFAFEGFRIIREKPKLVLFWGLVLLIANALVDVLVVAIAGPDFERMQAFVASAHPDPAVAEAIMPTLLLAIGTAVPILLIAAALLLPAVSRAIWNDKTEGGDRFGYLRIGADEFRQFAVIILYVFIGLALILAAALVAGVLAALTGSAATVVAPALFFVGLAGVVIVLVRLSLCGVQSFDRKRIDLFGSWKLTSNHGWTLLGGYVVVVVMVAFVNTLCFVIFGAIVVGFNGGQWGVVDHLMHTDSTSLQAYFTPVMIAREVFGNLLVAPLLLGLVTGAPAAAYRTLSGQVQDPGV